MSQANRIDTLVIGAGQAGLATSRWLQKRNIPHAVLERGRIGHSWRTQRWNSFHLNTPNLINLLPDDRYEGDAPFGFVPATELVRDFEAYRARHQLPIEEGVEVTAVRPVEGGFEVEVAGRVRSCRNVVVCSGDQNHPRIPPIAAQLPDDVVQLHAADYRCAADLPEGSALVVGSGQSGVQIAEDLLEAQRQVYLCTSAVARAPRRYRGRDLTEWMQMAGLGEQRPQDLEDPNEVRAAQPQISGTRGGHTLCLHQLARDGATLLGRLKAADGRVLQIEGDLQANVAKADAFSTKLKGMVDMLIDKAGIDAPPAEVDPVEAPFEGIAAMAAIRQLDLDEANIRTIIWATGFKPQFGYLDPSLLDERGYPRHQEGISDVPGLYCLGFTWLRRRFSGLVAGVDADAQHIVEQIAARRAS